MNIIKHFAGYARYYNLDIMMGYNGKNAQEGDTLYRWAIIQDKILKKTRKRSNLRNRYELVELIRDKCSVELYNLKGENITNVEQVIEEDVKIDIVQGYCVQYIFELIKRMRYKICEIRRKDYRMPDLDEFFSEFSDYWKPYQIRNKKNWFKF